MLTAKDAMGDKVVGLDSGADDYMIKPFGHQELLARLRALLRRPRQTLPVKLVVGSLVIDTSNKEAVCKNNKLPLTVKEFSLLEYFMRNPNQVLSREQILEHIWNYDFNSFANVVDVHVKNLRKKLSKVNYEHVLQTIRGMGYKLTV
jgi:DNA-binding response OmpR family regulator